MVENYTNQVLQKEVEENQEGDVSNVSKKKYQNLKYGDEIMVAIDLAENLRDEYI